MSEVVRFNDKSVIPGTEARQKILVDATAGGKDMGAIATIMNANYLRIRVEASSSTSATVAARFNIGTDMTVTDEVGVPMANLDVFTFGPDEVKQLYIISADANTQTMWCTWYNV